MTEMKRFFQSVCTLVGKIVDVYNQGMLIFEDTNEKSLFVRSEENINSV